MLNLFTLIRNKMLPGGNILHAKSFSTGHACCEKLPDAPPTAAESVNPHIAAKTLHRPNNFERRLLVWTGKYKTKEEIPNMVSMDVMERTRNRARIRIANYMMAATAIACIAMAISGKRAAERGESVQKMNLDWHKEMDDKFKKDKADTTS